MNSRLSDEEVARTRAFWMARKPSESVAPAYVPDPPDGWRVALVLAAALLLQSTLAPLIVVRGAPISLVTLLVGWYGVRAGAARGFVFGTLAGAGEDVLAGGTGAAWTIATGIAGMAAGRLAGTWLADTRLALVPGAALLTLGRFAAFAIALQGEGRPLVDPAHHLHVALLQSALDAAVAFVALIRWPSLRGTPAHRR